MARRRRRMTNGERRSDYLWPFVLKSASSSILSLLLLKSDCCETTVNGAQRFAKPKERPPGKAEDEDELEGDYDYVQRGSRVTEI